MDDDLGVRVSLVRLVTSARLQAEAFSSPDALVERLSEDAAGCLVMDVRMPGLNGLDLYDSLVASKKALPVVFLSAYLDVGLTVRAMKAGAIDVLQKPFEPPPSSAPSSAASRPTSSGGGTSRKSGCCAAGTTR